MSLPESNGRSPLLFAAALRLVSLGLVQAHPIARAQGEPGILEIALNAARGSIPEICSRPVSHSQNFFASFQLTPHGLGIAPATDRPDR
jgi:hypothetical protein